MNYKKYILLAILALLFISSGLYNLHNNKSYLFYLSDPIGQDKTEISLAGSIISKDNENILIRESMYGKEVMIKSVHESWLKGQFVNLKGIFHKEGYIEFKKGELIWDKKIKFVLSAGGFLIFLIILFRDRKKLKFDF
jgi:hypothetical protein